MTREVRRWINAVRQAFGLHKPGRRPIRLVRPQLEALEKRLVLSVYFWEGGTAGKVHDFETPNNWVASDGVTHYTTTYPTRLDTIYFNGWATTYCSIDNVENVAQLVSDTSDIYDLVINGTLNVIGSGIQSSWRARADILFSEDVPDPNPGADPSIVAALGTLNLECSSFLWRSGNIGIDNSGNGGDGQVNVTNNCNFLFDCDADQYLGVNLNIGSDTSGGLLTTSRLSDDDGSTAAIILDKNPTQSAPVITVGQEGEWDFNDGVHGNDAGSVKTTSRTVGVSQFINNGSTKWLRNGVYAEDSYIQCQMINHGYLEVDRYCTAEFTAGQVLRPYGATMDFVQQSGAYGPPDPSFVVNDQSKVAFSDSIVFQAGTLQFSGTTSFRGNNGSFWVDGATVDSIAVAGRDATLNVLGPWLMVQGYSTFSLNVVTAGGTSYTGRIYCSNNIWTTGPNTSFVLNTVGGAPYWAGNQTWFLQTTGTYYRASDTTNGFGAVRFIGDYTSYLETSDAQDFFVGLI